jgi:hypothetical protein
MPVMILRFGKIAGFSPLLRSKVGNAIKYRLFLLGVRYAADSDERSKEGMEPAGFAQAASGGNLQQI